LKVEFNNSFLRDLKQLREKRLKARVAEMIRFVEQAEGLDAITGLKKLSGESRYYRLRLGDYRAGIMLDDDTVVFVRFLHRKDIYRYFP
jgi:mRNA interferase RelE/StbE